MTTIRRPNYRALAEALRRRVLDGPGEIDRVVRRATAERAAGGTAAATPMMISRAKLVSPPLASPTSKWRAS
jgi:hypothetical protein